MGVRVNEMFVSKFINIQKNSENYDVYVDDNGDVILIKNKGDLKVFITYLQAHMTKNIYKEIALNNCTSLDEHIEKYDLK